MLSHRLSDFIWFHLISFDYKRFYLIISDFIWLQMILCDISFILLQYLVNNKDKIHMRIMHETEALRACDVRHGTCEKEGIFCSLSNVLLTLKNLLKREQKIQLSLLAHVSHLCLAYGNARSIYTKFEKFVQSQRDECLFCTVEPILLFGMN